jgi:ankyrin repeat protein
LEKRPDLIDQSLTINFKTTPLHRAAVNGNLKLAELFLDKYNATIDFKTSNGETALIGAIKKNKI